MVMRLYPKAEVIVSCQKVCSLKQLGLGLPSRLELKQQPTKICMDYEHSYPYTFLLQVLL